MSRVWIEHHQGRLRLRWWYERKRQTLPVGVPDNPTGRALAKQKAAQIELDLQTGHYDPTKLKYKPRVLGKTATELSCPKLFERYTLEIAREKALSNGALCKYQGAKAHLQRRLDIPAHLCSEHITGNFVAYLLENVSNQTAKQYLWLIKSCWDWAQGKYHVQPENPWIAQVQRIRPQPTQKVKPFTAAEIQAITSAFRAHPQYRHYHDFVVFLFGVGCRFGEAAGLRWSHIGVDYGTVWIGESISRGHRKTTKTGKDRTIVLNCSIQIMLRTRFECLNPKPDDLVFPAPRGGPINDRNFSRRAWKTILEQCNVAYRRVYTARHTAISHALANGADPIAVAEQAGHDKRVLLDSYAHVIQAKSVFQEF